MNFSRKCFFVSLVALTMPLLANAHPLSIVNATDSPLSFTVNYKCSEEIGTLQEVEVKAISEETLNKICLNYTQPCTITAHYGDHCAGEPIGGIRYNSEHNFEVNGSHKNISITATESTLIYTSPIKNKA